jgi:hypothetical protein
MSGYFVSDFTGALRARLVGPVPRGFHGLSPASHSPGRQAPGEPTGPFGGMRDNGSASVPPPTRGSHSASRDVGKEFRGPRRTATATEPKAAGHSAPLPTSDGREATPPTTSGSSSTGDRSGACIAHRVHVPLLSQISPLRRRLSSSQDLLRPDPCPSGDKDGRRSTEKAGGE